MTAEPLPLLRGGRWYASRDTCPVPGGPALSLAPEIMVRDDAARVRRTELPALPDDRLGTLREAVELFRHGTVHVQGIGPQDPRAFAEAMRATAGLPYPLVDRWSRLLATSLEEIAQRAAQAPPEPSITLVSLPANTFTCLEAVLEALLTGGVVWIRPSRREPLSSARLLGALLAAGWPARRLGYYPTAPAVLPALMAATTRHILYGGDAVLPLEGPSTEVRGPGRACAVLGEQGPPDVVELARLVAADSGRFCTNVCLIAGDLGPAAGELARLLDSITLDPPDPRWPQAAVTPQEAERTERFLAPRLAGARVLTRRPLVTRAAGRTYLAPTLVEVDRPDHALVGCELPFPFAVAVRAAPASLDGLAARSRFVHAVPSATPLEGAHH